MWRSRSNRLVYRKLPSVQAALGTLILLACSPADVPSITGTATYEARVALSPDAELHLALLDVSRMDVAADVIAADTVRDLGQVPVAFELAYDSAKIVEGMAYAVRATIHDRGRLRFTTTSAYHVLTRGNPDTVSLVLYPVGQDRQPAAEMTDWRSKIEFDLDMLNDDGLRGPPDGLRSLGYEFCVPADEAVIAAVREIDRSLQVYRGSPGRIGCTEAQVLAIGETSQPDWRNVLEQLARRDDVDRIVEFFGE